MTLSPAQSASRRFKAVRINRFVRVTAWLRIVGAAGVILLCLGATQKKGAQMLMELAKGRPAGAIVPRTPRTAGLLPPASIARSVPVHAPPTNQTQILLEWYLRDATNTDDIFKTTWLEGSTNFNRWYRVTPLLKYQLTNQAVRLFGTSQFELLRAVSGLRRNQ